jgi:hypothetical protein
MRGASPVNCTGYGWRGSSENLRMFSTKNLLPSKWWVTQIRADPLFDSIRNEPEFKQIVLDVQFKYLAEHERVRKWLEENDMM